VLASGRAGAADATITGELKQWHKVTLSVPGPYAAEDQPEPNPFTDYRMTVTFRHQNGQTSRGAGYFAADGQAAETSATAGNIWRAHLSPDKPGRWHYVVEFVRGKNAAVGEASTEPVAACDGLTGSFEVTRSNKKGRDFRAKGRLQYVGGRYLRHAGSSEYFLKTGPDSPENFLACVDIDETYSAKKQGTQRQGEAAVSRLKTWASHIGDWRQGIHMERRPWQRNDRGAELRGRKGCNAFSFLTYNAGGDGDDVWPFIKRDEKLRYDCSKLDQWQIIFDHATRLGLFCHFKTQETENDDLKGRGSPGPGWWRP
jgi:hypothetical protein